MQSGKNSHLKNDPQTIHKLTFLHVKSSKNSGLEAPKSRSGGVLEASWGVLGPSWGVLWASWGRLGLPKTSQDRSKTPPRRLPRRAPTWVQHRPQLGNLREPKRMENVLKNHSKKPVLVSEREARLMKTSGCTRRKTIDVRKNADLSNTVEAWIF